MIRAAPDVSPVLMVRTTRESCRSCGPRSRSSIDRSWVVRESLWRPTTPPRLARLVADASWRPRRRCRAAERQGRSRRRCSERDEQGVLVGDASACDGAQPHHLRRRIDADRRRTRIRVMARQWPGSPPSRLSLRPDDESVLFSRSETNLGGTSQIQRNVIAKRILGLPKEPGPGG